MNGLSIKDIIGTDESLTIEDLIKNLPSSESGLIELGAQLDLLGNAEEIKYFKNMLSVLYLDYLIGNYNVEDKNYMEKIAKSFGIQYSDELKTIVINIEVSSNLSKENISNLINSGRQELQEYCITQLLKHGTTQNINDFLLLKSNQSAESQSIITTITNKVLNQSNPEYKSENIKKLSENTETAIETTEISVGLSEIFEALKFEETRFETTDILIDVMIQNIQTNLIAYGLQSYSWRERGFQNREDFFIDRLKNEEKSDTEGGYLDYFRLFIMLNEIKTGRFVENRDYNFKCSNQTEYLRYFLNSLQDPEDQKVYNIYSFKPVQESETKESLAYDFYNTKTFLTAIKTAVGEGENELRLQSHPDGEEAYISLLDKDIPVGSPVFTMVDGARKILKTEIRENNIVETSDLLNQLLESENTENLMKTISLFLESFVNDSNLSSLISQKLFANVMNKTSESIGGQFLDDGTMSKENIVGGSAVMTIITNKIVKKEGVFDEFLKEGKKFKYLTLMNLGPFDKILEKISIERYLLNKFIKRKTINFVENEVSDHNIKDIYNYSTVSELNTTTFTENTGEESEVGKQNFIDILRKNNPKLVEGLIDASDKAFQECKEIYKQNGKVDATIQNYLFAKYTLQSLLESDEDFLVKVREQYPQLEIYADIEGIGNGDMSTENKNKIYTYSLMAIEMIEMILMIYASGGAAAFIELKTLQGAGKLANLSTNQKLLKFTVDVEKYSKGLKNIGLANRVASESIGFLANSSSFHLTYEVLDYIRNGNEIDPNPLHTMAFLGTMKVIGGVWGILFKEQLARGADLSKFAKNGDLTDDGYKYLLETGAIKINSGKVMELTNIGKQMIKDYKFNKVMLFGSEVAILSGTEIVLDFIQDGKVNKFGLESVVNIVAMVAGLKFLGKYPLFEKAKRIAIKGIEKNAKDASIKLKLDVDGRTVFVNSDMTVENGDNVSAETKFNQTIAQYRTKENRQAENFQKQREIIIDIWKRDPKNSGKEEPTMEEFSQIYERINSELDKQLDMIVKQFEYQEVLLSQYNNQTGKNIKPDAELPERIEFMVRCVNEGKIMDTEGNFSKAFDLYFSSLEKIGVSVNKEQVKKDFLAKIKTHQILLFELHSDTKLSNFEKIEILSEKGFTNAERKFLMDLGLLINQLGNLNCYGFVESILNPESTGGVKGRNAIEKYFKAQVKRYPTKDNSPLDIAEWGKLYIIDFLNPSYESIHIGFYHNGVVYDYDTNIGQREFLFEDYKANVGSIGKYFNLGKMSKELEKLAKERLEIEDETIDTPTPTPQTPQKTQDNLNKLSSEKKQQIEQKAGIPIQEVIENSLLPKEKRIAKIKSENPGVFTKEQFEVLWFIHTKLLENSGGLFNHSLDDIRKKYDYFLRTNPSVKQIEAFKGLMRKGFLSAEKIELSSQKEAILEDMVQIYKQALSNPAETPENILEGLKLFYQEFNKGTTSSVDDFITGFDTKRIFGNSGLDIVFKKNADENQMRIEIERQKNIAIENLIDRHSVKFRYEITKYEAIEHIKPINMTLSIWSKVSHNIKLQWFTKNFKGIGNAMKPNNAMNNSFNEFVEVVRKEYYSGIFNEKDFLNNQLEQLKNINKSKNTDFLKLPINDKYLLVGAFEYHLWKNNTDSTIGNKRQKFKPVTNLIFQKFDNSKLDGIFVYQDGRIPNRHYGSFEKNIYEIFESQGINPLKYNVKIEGKDTKLSSIKLLSQVPELYSKKYTEQGELPMSKYLEDLYTYFYKDYKSDNLTEFYNLSGNAQKIDNLKETFLKDPSNKNKLFEYVNRVFRQEAHLKTYINSAYQDKVDMDKLIDKYSEYKSNFCRFGTDMTGTGKKATVENNNIRIEGIGTKSLNDINIPPELQKFNNKQNKLKKGSELYTKMSEYKGSIWVVENNGSFELVSGLHKAPVKSLPRATEKIISKDGDLSSITDLARSTIEYDNLSDMVTGVGDFISIAKTYGSIGKIDIIDKIGKPYEKPGKGSGYRDIKLLIEITKNGVTTNTVEIQFQVKNALEIKQKGRSIQWLKESTPANMTLTTNDLAKISNDKNIEQHIKDKFAKWYDIDSNIMISADNFYHIHRSLPKGDPLVQKLEKMESFLHEVARQEIISQREYMLINK